jgi:hypothetical protein
MTALSLVSGRACRTWTVNSETQPLIKHIVQLKADTNSGNIEVLLNGAPAHGFDGTKYSSVFDWPSNIPYTIPGVGSGTIFVARDQAFVEISCAFGELFFPCMELGTAASSPTLDISIPHGLIALDELNATVGWFLLHTKVSDGRETSVHRRFRDFSAINDTLRWAFRDSPILASFPEMAPKGIKLLEFHLSPAFIDKRRALLEEWARKMATIPEVRAHSTFSTFLGWVDQDRESSILLPAGLRLGLALATHGRFVKTVSVQSTDEGISNALQPGDSVRSVDRLT